MIRSVFARLFVVLFVCWAAGSSSAQPLYYLRELGEFGGTGGIAQDINALGQVVGTRFTSTGNHAFLWNPTTPNSPIGIMFDLGDLPGGIDDSEATGINSRGQVVGGSSASAGTHAFLWTPAASNGTTGAMVDLGDLAGGSSSSGASAINETGQVAGTGHPGSLPHAFLWTPSSPNASTGSFTDLGALPGGLDTSGGSDINSFGQVVGNSLVPTKEMHAFLWTPTASNATSGAMVDLGDLPGGSVFSDATAINEMGQVVGRGYPGSLPHAFLWTPSFANASTGAMIDLGGLYGEASSSAAADINSQGWVVGKDKERGFLWIPATSNATAGSMYDLNSLLDPASAGNWIFQSALAINDRGQIVGYGRVGGSGVEHALLLIPIPEPSALVLATFAVAMLITARRKAT